MSHGCWKRARVLALLALAGCGGGVEKTRDAGRTEGQPAWLAELPARTVEAAPGETVWAVVPLPGTAAAAVGTFRLEAVAGTRTVLADALGNRTEVPGALVHPVSAFPEAELEVGSVVLADRWDARKVVGRVADLSAGEVRLAFDWNGVTVTGAMDVAVPLAALGDASPLAWVVYRTPGETARYKGLRFAESGGRVWISDDGGQVMVVAEDAVERLADPGGEAFEEGDPVAAYSWGHGYRRGVIEAVLEPGLRYAVKVEAGPTRPYFFDSLTAAP